MNKLLEMIGLGCKITGIMLLVVMGVAGVIVWGWGIAYLMRGGIMG